MEDRHAAPHASLGATAHRNDNIISPLGGGLGEGTIEKKP